MNKILDLIFEDVKNDFESVEMANADVLFLYGTILLNDSSTIKK